VKRREEEGRRDIMRYSSLEFAEIVAPGSTIGICC
jgi:hypothetical protein